MIGPKMIGPVVRKLADHLQPWPVGLRVETQRQVVLVVAQVDVETRLVALDERVLQQQGLLFVGRDDRGDVSNDPFQEGHEQAAVARRGLEVLAHARAQIARLADVDRLAAPILHEIHAGFGRQAVQDLGDRLPSRLDLGFAHQRRRGPVGVVATLRVGSRPRRRRRL